MDLNLDNINFIDGTVLLFDKPLDWTSFDVVNKIRWKLQKKLNLKKLKVGHAGTLDPKATGLIILCTGKATKQIDSIQAIDKEYIATIKLGATTPSFDLETEENTTFPIDDITIDSIKEVLPLFTGEIDQVPPIYSAIRINGKRAFSYARQGKELEMTARKVTVFDIQIISYEKPELILKIRCSKGTYIRSLANDIGAALHNGAYLTGLRRTAIGENLVENAFTIEIFDKLLETI